MRFHDEHSHPHGKMRLAHGGPGPHGGRGGKGGRGGGRGRRGGPGRPRVSRGDVRAAVLALLAESAMHGYQLMQELEERSGGAWHPSPGSIYPTLQQLADEGLVTSASEGGKNIFSLTSAGTEANDSNDEPPPWERFDPANVEGFVNLRKSVFQLTAAAKQVGSAGTTDQVERAKKIIDDARKNLYKVLAEDDADEAQADAGESSPQD